MTWYIYDSEGNQINKIAGDEEFIKALCGENEWTYKIDSVLAPENVVGTFPTLEDQKISALDMRQDFLEDCIAEMAMQIYD